MSTYRSRWTRDAARRLVDQIEIGRQDRMIRVPSDKLRLMLRLREFQSKLLACVEPRANGRHRPLRGLMECDRGVLCRFHAGRRPRQKHSIDLRSIPAQHLENRARGVSIRQTKDVFARWKHGAGQRHRLSKRHVTQLIKGSDARLCTISECRDAPPNGAREHDGSDMAPRGPPPLRVVECSLITADRSKAGTGARLDFRLC